MALRGASENPRRGLHVLKLESDDLRARYPRVVEAHLRPEPRVKAGALLASCGASAMEDVSDGLAADLRHICDESGLGCQLEARLVPLADDLRALAAEVGEDPFELGAGRR